MRFDSRHASPRAPATQRRAEAADQDQERFTRSQQKQLGKKPSKTATGPSAKTEPSEGAQKVSRRKQPADLRVDFEDVDIDDNPGTLSAKNGQSAKRRAPQKSLLNNIQEEANDDDTSRQHERGSSQKPSPRLGHEEVPNLLKRKKPRAEQEELAERIQGHLETLGGSGGSLTKKKLRALGEGPAGGFED